MSIFKRPTRMKLNDHEEYAPLLAMHQCLTGRLRHETNAPRQIGGRTVTIPIVMTSCVGGRETDIALPLADRARCLGGG